MKFGSSYNHYTTAPLEPVVLFQRFFLRQVKLGFNSFSHSLFHSLLHPVTFSNFIGPFYGWGSTALGLQSHYEETIYFLPRNPWNSVLI